MILGILMLFAAIAMFVMREEGRWPILIGAIWSLNVGASNLGTLGYVALCILVYSCVIAFKAESAKWNNT